MRKGQHALLPLKNRDLRHGIAKRTRRAVKADARTAAGEIISADAVRKHNMLLLLFKQRMVRMHKLIHKAVDGIVLRHAVCDRHDQKEQRADNQRPLPEQRPLLRKENFENAEAVGRVFSPGRVSSRAPLALPVIILIVMTIPFRCAEGTKRHEKALRRYTALKILC